MRVSVAVLADGANAVNGRLSLLGITKQIVARAFPVKTGFTWLVVQVHLDEEERSQELKARAISFRADSPEAKVQFAEFMMASLESHQDSVNFIAPMLGLTIESPGDYIARIELAGMGNIDVPYRVVSESEFLNDHS
jgi:hypothetical protein